MQIMFIKILHDSILTGIYIKMSKNNLDQTAALISMINTYGWQAQNNTKHFLKNVIKDL